MKLPVIWRELRTEARHGFTYWLRVLGAAAVIVVFLTLMITEKGSSNLGAQLFSCIHTTILVAIWILVPPMTADCIARERREGTLGLLFLTPLSARQIVFGKAIVHILRAFGICLAAFPILAIPILLGGVEWLDVYTAISLETCSLLLALAAGMAASAFTKKFGRALLLAEILAAIFAIFFGELLVVIFWPNAVGLIPGLTWEDFMELEVWVLGPVVLGTGLLEGSWSQLLNVGMVGAGAVWPIYITEVVLSGVLMFLAVMFLSVRRVSRTWQDLPRSARQVWMLKTFCTPTFWRGVFRRKMSRALDRNPIMWLQQHSWSARLIKWSWCFAAILAHSILIGMTVDGYNSWPGDFLEGQLTIGAVILGGMCFSIAGSFRNERQSGALELLLVTPLRERQIINGRVRGIMAQFFPAALVMLLTWSMAVRDIRDEYRVGEGFMFLVFFSSFVTLPFIGLYLSMRFRNYFVVLIGMMIIGLLGPGTASFGIAWSLDQMFYGQLSWRTALTMMMTVTILSQLILGIIAARRLYLLLERRAFITSD